METFDQPLDERKERILREIVEEYIRSGEPVGSKAIAEGSGLGVSSATVRNEMGTLEREGYICAPHTSAGRIPTDRGYRYYVDVLAPRVAENAERRREIEHFLLGTLTALDELLERASQLLVELTDFTSVAAGPPMREARIRHVQLVPLGGGRLFLIVVGEGVWHEERILELGRTPPEEEIARAMEQINRLVAGLTVPEAARALAGAEAEPPRDEVLGATLRAIRLVAEKKGRVITGGTSRLVIWEPPLTAQRVLEILEEGGVAPLLRPEPQPDQVAVRIGRELVLEDLHDLSLIASGYRFGRWAGTLGVLGPTRMDYPTVISTVAEVARSLDRALRRLVS